jgi:hypothetical protein
MQAGMGKKMLRQSHPRPKGIPVGWEKLFPNNRDTFLHTLLRAEAHVSLNEKQLFRLNTN